MRIKGNISEVENERNIIKAKVSSDEEMERLSMELNLPIIQDDTHGRDFIMNRLGTAWIMYERKWQ